MYKIAVMGSQDSIYGFATYTDGAEAAKKLRELAENDFAIIYVTEELAAKMPNEIARFREEMLPAIILIPGVSGNTGEGISGVKKSVEQAVGSDILFGNE